MLNTEKIEVYRRFKGDADGFSRTQESQRSDITDDDWSAIDELRQSLFIVAAGKASPEFAASVERRLSSCTPDERTRQALRDLVSELA